MYHTAMPISRVMSTPASAHMRMSSQRGKAEEDEEGEGVGYETGPDR